MKKSFCSYCRTAVDEEDLTEFDGELLCPSCLASETSICRDCGTRIWNRDDVGDGNYGSLCLSCRDDHYTACTQCGCLLHDDDACYMDEESDSPYCSSCMEELTSENIHNYYYKPAPIFYGEGPRYLGVELEIDEGGESNDNAERILAVANDMSERCYCKHDGSLDDGFEIVTHPMSLRYHETEMPWDAVLKKAVRMGYRSHQANTCGLHVHVSRAAFGDTEAEQDAVIGRILFFTEKHWAELLKFSRRTQYQLNRWACRYGYKDRPRDMLEHAKKGPFGRYACINLTNRSTIEFRLFRGTLKLNTLIATLQLVDRICALCTELEDEEIRELSWAEFVSSLTETELISCLKERRLYVNEPVESEAEI